MSHETRKRASSMDKGTPQFWSALVEMNQRIGRIEGRLEASGEVERIRADRGLLFANYALLAVALVTLLLDLILRMS